jgi:hypothetical protein
LPAINDKNVATAPRHGPFNSITISVQCTASACCSTSHCEAASRMCPVR